MLTQSLPSSLARPLLLALFALGLPAAAAPSDLPPDLASAYASIRPADVYQTCRQLCLPRFAGRFPGTPEYRELCELIATTLEAHRLEPGAEGSFLQPYSSPCTTVEDASLKLILPAAEGTAEEPVDLEPGVDFLPLLYSDSGVAEGGVVFVGFGISAPELGYDDYGGMDVKGRFALCFRGTPDDSNRAFQDHDEHRTRMRAARERGALGLIYIYETPIANPNGERLERFFPAMISDRQAGRILAGNGTDAAKLRAELLETKQPRSFVTGARVQIAVKARYVADAVAYNVIGIVRGSDPALRHESVVVGAHLDHCGRHLGLLFPGANDNASGSACVLQAARAFSRLKQRPRRSVVFVLFGGEERGLEGSNLFVEKPPAAAGRMMVMLNLDMVGEGDGSGAAIRPGYPALKEAVESADRTVGTVRSLHEFSGPPGVRGSDYAPFYLAGLPCLTFSSNGPHVHYHETRDTIYRINPDMLADMTRLTFLTAFYLADGPSL
ncbi:MAG: M20/M25/M40 family metallo-hydrolase [Planctomycetota bacterium]